MAFTVRQRTREIGLHIAVGADERTILGHTLRAGLRTAALGTAVGAGAAPLVLGRLFQSLLYGVGAVDPLTYALVAMILVAVSLAACCLPALRAARTDPTRALRSDP